MPLLRISLCLFTLLVLHNGGIFEFEFFRINQWRQSERRIGRVLFKRHKWMRSEIVHQVVKKFVGLLVALQEEDLDLDFPWNCPLSRRALFSLLEGMMLLHTLQNLLWSILMRNWRITSSGFSSVVTYMNYNHTFKCHV